MKPLVTLPACILDRLATDQLVVGPSPAEPGKYLAGLVATDTANSCHATGTTPEDAIGNLEQLLWKNAN